MGKVDKMMTTCAPAAAAAMAPRDRVLYLISHELRSPLHGMQAWVGVLEQQLDITSPLIQRALAGIRLGIAQQARLVDQLIDAAQIVGGEFRLACVRVPMLPVLHAALDSVRDSAAARGIRIDARIDIGTACVEGDAARLEQMLRQLLTNAIKFSPDGQRVEMQAKVVGTALRIAVRDHGIGFAKAALPMLFTSFWQAEEPTTRRDDGLGLGLALVKRLTDLHRGTIRARSNGIGRGATFVLTLPRIVHDAVHDADAAQHDVPEPRRLDGIRILLVDDLVESRESLAAWLGGTGAIVRTAACGRDVMALLRNVAADARPHVLICDIALPEENGYAVLAKLRKWEREQGIAARDRMPAIALSAFVRQESGEQGDGFQLWLDKPVMPATLQRQVLAVVAGDRQAVGLSAA
jgi:CheY-like chemotaxis protein/anti-sigma regulatory factor (Ser/Thr protein kinase)